MRETRVCVRCFGTGRTSHCETPAAQPVIVPCRTCGGDGEVLVFVYATRTTLRRMDEAEVVSVCWNGSVRERAMAEHELRRREGGSRER